MNYAQLGAKVKAKYPQYKDISDDELGKRVVAKHPEYKAQITEEPQQNLLGQAADILIPQTKKFAEQLVSIPGLYKEALTDPKAASEKAVQLSQDLMNTKNKAGLELSAYAMPFGNTAKARAGYGAISGGMIGASKDDANPLSVATGALTGGVLSPITGAVTDVAGKVVSKAGGKVQQAGEKLVLKSFKDSQVKQFKKKTGQNLAQWLAENKITGNYESEVQRRLSDVQGKYDELTINSGKTVDVGKLQNKFIKRIQAMSDDIDPASRGKAKDLQAVMDNFKTKHGDKVTLETLVKERRAIDAKLSDRQYPLPQEAANYLKLARDAIKEVIDETTETMGDKGTKVLGRELRGLYAFRDILENQTQGGSSIKLINSIMSVAGGQVAGIPGAVGGYLMTEAARNPTVLSAGSQVMQRAGRKMQSAKIPLPQGMEALQRALRNTTASQLSRPSLP